MKSIVISIFAACLLGGCSWPKQVHVYSINFTDQGISKLAGVTVDYEIGYKDSIQRKTMVTSDDGKLVDTIMVEVSERIDPRTYDSFLEFIASCPGYNNLHGRDTISSIHLEYKDKQFKTNIYKMTPIIQEYNFIAKSGEALLNDATYEAKYYGKTKITPVKTEKLFSSSLNFHPFINGEKPFSKIEVICKCPAFHNDTALITVEDINIEKELVFELDPIIHYFELMFIDDEGKPVENLEVTYVINKSVRDSKDNYSKGKTNSDGVLKDSVMAKKWTSGGFGDLQYPSRITYKIENEGYALVYNSLENRYGDKDAEMTSPIARDTIVYHKLTAEEIREREQIKREKEIYEKSKYSVWRDANGVEWYQGARVYTGPRGGKYYYNSNGNKQYVPR